MASVGKTNTQQLKEKTMEHISTVMSLPKANKQDLPSLKSSGTQLKCLNEDDEAKSKLGLILADCFDSLKLYGKSPDSVKSSFKFFQMVLADYTFEQIEEAFVYYLKNSSEFPTPADIATIIERGGKPPFSEAVYVNLCKKRDRQPEQMEPHEWEYVREYENYILKG